MEDKGKDMFLVAVMIIASLLLMVCVIQYKRIQRADTLINAADRVITSECRMDDPDEIEADYINARFEYTAKYGM